MWSTTTTKMAVVQMMVSQITINEDGVLHMQIGVGGIH